MFFNIFYTGIFTDVKAMNTVMLGILHTAVINAAAGNNHDVTVFADIKVIINGFLQTALGKDDRDMHALMHRAWFDADIDAAAVFFGGDIDIRGGISSGKTSVGTEIIGACRNLVQIGNFTDQSFLNFIQLYHAITPLSACCRHPARKPCRSAGDRFRRGDPAVQSARRKAPRFHRRFSGYVPDER